MREQFSRTVGLIGETAFEKLRNSRVLLFGVGGVGSQVCESLVRSGIGHICIVDGDTVSESNINRQTQALHSTVGKSKVFVTAERMRDINPDIDIEVRETFYLPENADEIDFSRFDYVCDAVDTVSAKLEIISRADKSGVPVISCMGTGNKLFPEMLCVCDIYQTEGDPLARVMRRELRAREIKSLRVVFSKETPRESEGRTPNSMCFVPNAAGILCASQIVRELIK